MKKAIMFGFGFTVGARLAKMVEAYVDEKLLKLMANSDTFMEFLRANKPDLAEKIEAFRRK
jgi:hypothetical protein